MRYADFFLFCSAACIGPRLLAVFLVSAGLLSAPRYASTQVGGRSTVEATFYTYDSPVVRTAYEWKWSASTPIVVASRLYAGGFAQESEVGLLTDAQRRAAWASLEACDGVGEAWDGPPPANDGLLLVISDGGEIDRRWLRDPHEVAPACVRALREPVLRAVDVPPPRNVFWLEGEYGLLRSATNVPAEVWVDGVRTGQLTPVSDLRVEPGTRTVRWIAVESGAEREETVRVGVGQTTTINVSL